MPVTHRRFAGAATHARQLDAPVRVAHLTDQHFGRMTPMAVQMEAVERVNAERPDFVAITGDFVAHSLAFLDQIEHAVAALEAPVYCVMGNHDHWTGARPIRKALRKAGAEVLDNRWTTLTVRRQRVQIVGLDDAYTGHADRRQATRGLDPEALPTLALSHIAEEADALWALGVPLVLAGHTHGGQVSVGNMHRWTVGAFAGHKYVHGLYGDRGTDRAVYVSAGIGAAVVPFRAGDRGQREVATFELGAVPGSLTDEHHAEQAALPGRKPSAWTRERRRKAAQRKAARRAASGEG